jgi:anti-anti-sigma factor
MIPFEVRLESDLRVVVVGELDMATAPQVTEAIDSLARAGAQRVVVDLAGVSFLDSTGVSALCLAQAKLEVSGAVLVLGPLSSQVDGVLRMVGLEGEFVRESPGA